MKIWILPLLALVLSGCMAPLGEQPTRTGEVVEPTSQEKEETVDTQNHPLLEDFGPAPELANVVWLNSEAPLRLADLGGQVVLLDMWTFG